MYKHTIESYRNALRLVHGSSITFEQDEFLGVSPNQLHTCKIHGNWLARPDSVLLGSGCPKCDGDSKRKQYQLSKEEIQKRLDKAHNGNIQVVGDYVNQRTKLEFYCKKHKEKWHTILDTVIRGKGCPKCSYGHQSGKAFTKKPYKLGSKTVSVMGYEPFALDYIQGKGHRPSDIIVDTNKIPIIKYGKRKHFPDILVKSRNLLVEVKSPFTFFSTKFCYENIKRKRKAAIDSGYNYKVLMFNDDGSLVPLPRNWWELSYKGISKKLQTKCRTFS